MSPKPSVNRCPECEEWTGEQVWHVDADDLIEAHPSWSAAIASALAYVRDAAAREPCS